MTGTGKALWKFGVFAVTMTLLTASLFMIFGQYRAGTDNTYGAVFTDASRLVSGDSVRAAGIRVGTVRKVELQPDDHALVTFEADRSVRLTMVTKAAIRYLNLTGDRYLELLDQPGSTRLLPPGSQIPPDRTAPALDLDLLLGGLKPVIASLNPNDVNALSTALLQIFQGQGDTLESLFAKTTSFTTSVADKSEVIGQVIDNLNSVAGTIATDGERFAETLDSLQRLLGELAEERNTVGAAIDSLSSGTASIAQLLSRARPPLTGSIGELDRLSTNLEQGLPQIDDALQRAPGNYRRLVRLGSYGAWLNYYLCGIQLRLSDLQGRTAVFPWVKQETGRCADS